jgi:hypothetical protein
MDGGGVGGLDEEFEDSLGDFDEAVSEGPSGGGGGEEIDILDPMGEGGSGVPTDEPLFEEGDTGGGGDSAENQSVAQRAESGASGSSASGGEQGDSSDSQSGSQQSQSQSASGSGGGAAPEQGNRETGGLSSEGAEAGAEEEIIAIPEDVGDGRNDDIVLRQIREAATNESDPVLREKLWDEYRRIRGSK